MESRLGQKERELVAVGASVAAGCIPCTHYHVKAVREAGANTEEVTRAIEVALCVKGGTISLMREIAYEDLGLAARDEPACCTDPLSQTAPTAEHPEREQTPLNPPLVRGEENGGQSAAPNSSQAAAHRDACDTDRWAALVSIAAAVAVNSPTDFHRHVRTGRALGLRADEIAIAVALARMIRAKAAEKADHATEELTPSAPPTSCCGSSTSP